MANTSPPSFRRRLGRFVLWAVLPLAVGIALSLLVPRPIVGLIYLDHEIYSDTANSFIAQIAYARQHPEVRAVVLIVDSPGGTVIDTEAVYQELERLRQAKPVIASVESLAASGAYYLTAGTDYIFAKPSSSVGNIGVVGILPSSPTVYEGIIATGPYKQWGAPSDTVLRQMDVVKQEFYQAVKLGRGNVLRASQEVLLRGQIWPGNEALRLGLVDELGSRSQAIEKAASMAHISHYQVADLRVKAGLPPLPSSWFYLRTPQGLATPQPNESGLYLLYIPPNDGRLP